jgi:hypothetical protein
MIFINEWLPNPTGVDTKGEFIELFNSGSSSVNLDDWILKTTAKKSFLFRNQAIAPNSYLVLEHSQTKISLKNTNEYISLYDAGGHLVDHSSFIGTAQEGRSLSRINQGADTSEHFTWSSPTPGIQNKITLKTTISSNLYDIGVAINHPFVGFFGIFGMVIGIGAFFAALVVYSLQHEERLQKLFLS